MWKCFCNIFSRTDRFRLGILLVVMLLGSLMELASLGAVPVYVAVVLGKQEAVSVPFVGKLWAQFGGGEASRVALLGGIFLGVLFACRTLYLVFSHWLQVHVLANRWVATGSRFFRGYMGLPYVKLRRQNTNMVIDNVNRLSERVICISVDTGVSFLRNAVIVLTVFGILLYFDPLVSICAFLALGCAGVGVLATVNKRMKWWGQEEQKCRQQALKVICEGAGVNREARILGCTEYFCKILHTNLEQLTRCWSQANLSRRSLWPLMELVTVGVLLGTMGILLHSGRSFSETAPIIALMLACLARLKGCLTELMLMYSVLRGEQANLLYAGHELEELQRLYAPETEENDNLDGDIEVRGVTFSYPDGTAPVLNNVSFVIHKGERVGFVGTTGAGKSTMAELLLGLLTPDSGEICVSGKNINDNMRGWRQNVGYVPQDIYLLDDTICANVALGQEKVDEKRLRQALQVANISDFVATLPDGVNTVLGERGVRLSGGQRQRLGIARALYHDVSILIFDEATSALDNSTENEVVEALNGLQDGRTIIMVAHRLTTLRDCNRIFQFTPQGVKEFGSLEAYEREAEK